MIDSFAVRDTSVFHFRMRMNFAVAGISYFAVFVDGFAFTDVPGDCKVNDDSGRHAQIDQEHHGQPVEPHCGLYFPGNAAEHA